MIDWSLSAAILSVLFGLVKWHHWAVTMDRRDDEWQWAQEELAWEAERRVWAEEEADEHRRMPVRAKLFDIAAQNGWLK